MVVWVAVEQRMNTVISGHRMAKIKYTYLHSRMGGWGMGRMGKGEDG